MLFQVNNVNCKRTLTRWTVSLKVFIFSDKSDAKHLFTALSVQGKTKASLLSFHLYIFYAETSFLKIINEETTQLYGAILSLGSYRVQRWRWNMNSYEWTWFEFQKASQSRKLFEGRLERFLAGYKYLVFCVRVLKNLRLWAMHDSEECNFLFGGRGGWVSLLPRTCLYL